MNAAPALSMEQGAHDLIPWSRLHPPADRIEILPLDTEEMRGVTEANGPIYASWLRYWHSLDPSERDLLTYPAWIAGHLKGQLRSGTGAATAVIVTLGGGEILTLLPVTVPQAGTLHHAPGFDSKSWALARSDQRGAFEALFHAREGRHRPRSLYLESIDSTNVILDCEWPRLHTPFQFRSLIELDDGYDAMLSRLDSRTRNGVRRLLKKISKQHRLELETVVAASEMEGAFERFLGVDDRSWKKVGGNSLRGDARERESLRSSMAHMSREDRAVVQFLRADGADIAAQLCAVVDSQLLVIKTSYDDRWSSFGPGKLLLDESMRTWCPRNSIQGLNLVTGLRWHQQWAPRRIQTQSLWLFALHMRGKFARVRDVPLRETVKAVLRETRLERPARRLLRRLRA